jgi:hypothetical protein
MAAAKKKKKTSTRTTAPKKTATRAKKAPAAAPTPEQDMLVVGSKTRQLIKDAGCNTGGDALDGLNEKLHQLISQAVARATTNGRKTVRKYDF